ncbi:hypothetical protein SAMN02745134_00082 [Clostridium acidisoli DSM 12555]|uniref:Uncharacterized protein n=1 Tax=Clostridium acidisoli DSM 12555 TaxID=1121291 RepID=A0A1W1WXX1_9CLOT|nr:hypothetical protein [Clostridium acidisoli]SMC16457.1 hypothetical protein SAMN02745134_00082 [Clostridium acidisoli DSM 12555]
MNKYIWSDKMYNILKSLYANRQNKKEDKLINGLTDMMFPIEYESESKQKVALPELIIKLQVDYIDSGDISNIANYIMDLDSSHSSIYFIEYMEY